MPTLELTPLKASKKTSLTVKSNNNELYSFVTGYNKITKEEGWRPTNIPGFDPVSPVMIVHDILEHFPGDEYDPHNEYQAQGAMFWLRHEGGFEFDSETSKAVIKPAFGMLFHHIVRKDLTTELCPSVQEAHTPLENISTDNEMHRTLFNAREYVMGIGQYSREAFSFPDGVGKRLGRKRLLKSLEQALGWMRIGYRRAALRYRGLDKKKLVRLYENIVKLFERFDKLQRYDTLEFIDAVTMTINYRKYEADVSTTFLIDSKRRSN